MKIEIDINTIEDLEFVVKKLSDGYLTIDYTETLLDPYCGGHRINYIVKIKDTYGNTYAHISCYDIGVHVHSKDMIIHFTIEYIKNTSTNLNANFISFQNAVAIAKTFKKNELT